MTKNKNPMEHQRNKAALVAITRNSAGPMKDRRKKRVNRNTWKKELERDGLV